MRDATLLMMLSAHIDLISIHASHAGRDREPTLGLLRFIEFQSTRPMRDATNK